MNLCGALSVVCGHQHVQRQRKYSCESCWLDDHPNDAIKEGESGSRSYHVPFTGELAETTAMDRCKVGRFLGRRRRWALFLGFHLIAFSSWLPGSGLLAQSDILHGKSAVKVTSLDKTTPIENIRLVQNPPSDTTKLLEWLQSVSEEDKKDLRFGRDRNALVVLLLIEAARQGRSRP